MAFEVWTPSDYAWVAERAHEELRILESHHPHHFGSLKHELASLLSEAQSFLLLWPPSSCSRPADVDSISCASACTAESSSYRIARKSKSIDVGREMGAELSAIEGRACECSSSGGGDDGGDGWMDGADAAIDKARECLRRIREVKEVIRPTATHAAAA
ncbi:uncharacterized protein LOC126410406 isoform X2 [Nymphaea colorata]|uniref:uncharacterized protein LOC126410406 isoform X2 n=1 Tax=Nymphaea colorata TaxID=210225 RepID=UPI00214ECC5C|nr:uncharacterized protein LOC126410406 isoform X2 [Nymphaea colorata]